MHVVPLFLLLPLVQAPPPGAPRPAIHRYALDPAKSEVGFDGSSTLHDFTGRTRDVAGEVRLDPARVSGSAGGRITVQAAALDTGDESRDEEMRRYLRAEEHPELVLELHGLEGALDGWRGVLRMDATFDLAGVPVRRALDVAIEPAGEGFRATGSVRFSIREHRITPPSKLVVSMHEEVRVWFDAVFAPLPAAELAASARELVLREHTQLFGGEARTRELTGRLFAAGDRLLWERGDELWITGGAAPLAVVDARAARSIAAPGAVDSDFAEAARTLASLREKLGALAPETRETAGEKIAASIARLELAAAVAPVPGAAELARDGGGVSIRLGGVEWARLDGLAGDEPFPPLLLAVDGLPAAVRAELARLAGVPAAFRLHAATPAGTRVIEGRFGAPAPGVLPEWALTPETWAAAWEADR